MSDSDRGVYTRDGAYVRMGVPTTHVLVSGALENLRRFKATDPVRYAATATSAAQITETFKDLFVDVDPEVVTRVGMHLISTIGAHVALGMHPTSAINIATHALLDLGGHLPEPPP